MTDPDWARMLDTMYEADGTLVQRASNEEYEYEMYHPLGQNVDQSPEGRRKELEYLEHAGLIEEFDDEGWIRPSERGLQVAHERHMSKRQYQTNAALVALTFSLVLVGLVGNIPTYRTRILGNLVIAVGILGIIYYTDIFEFRD